MKVLVTGGAGFIGSHIVDLLIQRGDEVIIIDNLSTGKEEQIHPQARFYCIDLNDPRLIEIVKEEQPDAIVHQAAQIHVPTSVENPVFDATCNIIGTLNVLEACRQANVQKVVYASSAAVYGNPQYLPLDEEHPVQPLSGYGISKHTPEHYLQVYHQLYGLDYTVLRYSNVYGIRQDPQGEGGVISIFLEKIFSGQPLVVFGNGEQTRDYIYVEDVAKANLAALSKGSREIINIGTGVATSLNELIEMFEEITGKELEVKHAPERQGDIKHSLFDIEKAIRLLDWQPKTSIREGLRKTYEYYKKQNHRIMKKSSAEL